MKMKSLVSAAVSMALMAGVATSAFAATPVPAAESHPKPTAQQTTELKQIRGQMKGVREQIIDKFVAFGWLTPEKAAQMKEHHTEKKGRPQQNRPDRENAGDRNLSQIRSKIETATAQQKAELAALRDQLISLHKQEVAKMISYGWTVPERGTDMKGRSGNPGFGRTVPQN